MSTARSRAEKLAMEIVEKLYTPLSYQSDPYDYVPLVIDIIERAGEADGHCQHCECDCLKCGKCGLYRSSGVDRIGKGHNSAVQGEDGKEKEDGRSI